MRAVTRRIAGYDCTIGEGPLWHSGERSLYWVDIPNGHLYRYDPVRDEHGREYEFDRSIGGFTIESDGALLVFTDQGGILRWHRGEGITGVVRDELPEEQDSRFNDVVAGPRGRVFAGTMPTEERLGRLYRIDTDGSVTRVDDGLDIPNGMGFSLSRSRLYLAVSDDEVIYEYDYDQATGDLSNRRVFVDTSGEAGVPDGLTVDSRGYVWCARWDDYCVARYTPSGVEERRVEVPPPKASSITFGGSRYDTAYITTAIGQGSNADDHSGAGALYSLEPPVTGVPEYRSRIGV